MNKHKDKKIKIARTC